MMLNRQQALYIMPAVAPRIDSWLVPINDTMHRYEIATPLRAAAYIAQLAHETGQLRWHRELWGPTPQQQRYERDFQRPWTRDDQRNSLAFMLGNSEAGDGSRFRGRGLFQLTGRTNYQKYSDYMGIDFIADPGELEEPQYGADSSGWYWAVFKGLSPLADVGDFEKITRRINGGLNGYADRLNYYRRAKTAFGVA